MREASKLLSEINKNDIGFSRDIDMVVIDKGFAAAGATGIVREVIQKTQTKYRTHPAIYLVMYDDECTEAALKLCDVIRKAGQAAILSKIDTHTAETEAEDYEIMATGFAGIINHHDRRCEHLSKRFNRLADYMMEAFGIPKYDPQ